MVARIPSLGIFVLFEINGDRKLYNRVEPFNTCLFAILLLMLFYTKAECIAPFSITSLERKRKDYSIVQCTLNFVFHKIFQER